MTRCRIRSLSSAAAFSVNVNATIDSAGSPSPHQVSDPLRDHLGLARPGCGDDLEVPAPVGDGGRGLALEHRWILGRRCASAHAATVREACMPRARGYCGRRSPHGRKGARCQTSRRRSSLSSPDLAAEKRAAFEDLFPGVLADGVLDVGRLSELLDIEPQRRARRPRAVRPACGLASRRRFGRCSRRAAATLVPDLDNSVDFDTAENVFIEGDNLEVLKLLQKAYNDKVKLIYIDPPYNTGNDFVYNDDFTRRPARLPGVHRAARRGGQSNVSAAPRRLGRRHSRWLSMMYPRLVLARNLLTQDGVIFVSIDDNEVAQPSSALLDEVFGAENFVATVIWQQATGRRTTASALRKDRTNTSLCTPDVTVRFANPLSIDPNIGDDSNDDPTVPATQP